MPIRTPEGMERGSKRKAAMIASSPETRSNKRHKTPDLPSKNPPAETTESATEHGLRYITQLRGATDKNGVLIATDFLTLPSRKDYPDYYEQTLLPLAVDTLERKLSQNDYSDLSALESDVKRMVQNAKDYNESHSDIVQNAERIRKLTHNWMSRNNPAYKNKSYQAQPTTLPVKQIRLNTAPRSTSIAEQNDAELARPDRRKSTIQERGRSVSTAHADLTAKSDPDNEEKSFDAKSFQQAQDQIITELLEALEPDGELKKFEPFANLPTRLLVDYYKVIKDPTSLKGVQKKIHGIHGRRENTGMTDYKSWDAFENDVKKIWVNARIYNEDGSEISELSKELEQRFHRRLADAKKVVSEPAQPTLKLTLSKPAPIKLRLGSQKQSPGPQTESHIQTSQPQRKTPTPGVSVDQSALERQKQHVQADVNGHSSALVQLPDPRAPTRSPSTAAQAPKSTGSAGSPSSVPNGIKKENQQSQSPAPGSIAAAPQSGSSSMPPPTRLTNGTSPHPIQMPPHQQAYTPPQTGPDSKFRQAGKDANDALIANVSLFNHPSLPNSKPLSLNIPAHPRLSQQSITFNLPSSQYLLLLSLALHPSITSGRAYKLFVTANGQRLSPTVQQQPPPPPPNGMGGFDPSAAAAIAAAAGPKRSLFDIKLVPGINRIEVECVAFAMLPKNDPATLAFPGSNGLEGEKVTCFVHLLR